MNPALTRAGVGVVVALAVAGALNFYRTVDERSHWYRDPWITDMFSNGPERFREFKAIVPPEAVLGYFSDLPDASANDWRIDVWYFGARYALAPRLVVPHDNPQKEYWILGNFSKPVDLSQFERENQLKLVRDFGSGVVLFRSW